MCRTQAVHCLARSAYNMCTSVCFAYFSGWRSARPGNQRQFISNSVEKSAEFRAKNKMTNAHILAACHKCVSAVQLGDVISALPLAAHGSYEWNVETTFIIRHGVPHCQFAAFSLCVVFWPCVYEVMHVRECVYVSCFCCALACWQLIAGDTSLTLKGLVQPLRPQRGVHECCIQIYKYTNM